MESPRGPISIDPETRNIVQTIYIREVRKVDGSYQNVIIDKIEAVKDPILGRLKNSGQLRFNWRAIRRQSASTLG